MAISTSGLGLEAAADRLGVSVARVRELIASDVLETITKGRSVTVVLPDTVSSTTAAALMGVTGGRVRQILRAEEMAATRLGPRAWAIPVAEIRKFNLAPPAPRGWPRGLSRATS